MVGDIDDAGHAQSGRKADAVFTPVREIHAELAACRALVVARGQALAAHMLSVADTPSSVKPLRNTCCTPKASASRALRSASSSTMKVAALYQLWNAVASSRR